MLEDCWIFHYYWQTTVIIPNSSPNCVQSGWFQKFLYLSIPHHLCFWNHAVLGSICHFPHMLHACHMHRPYLCASFSSPEVQPKSNEIMSLVLIAFPSKHKMNIQSSIWKTMLMMLLYSLKFINTSHVMVWRLCCLAGGVPHREEKWYMSLVSSGQPLFRCESVFNLIPERAKALSTNFPHFFT